MEHGENILFYIEPAHNLFHVKSVSPKDIPNYLLRTRKNGICTLWFYLLCNFIISLSSILCVYFVKFFAHCSISVEETSGFTFASAVFYNIPFAVETIDVRLWSSLNISILNMERWFSSPESKLHQNASINTKKNISLS